MFLDFVLEGHATRRYAEGHAEYLLHHAQQSAKELESAVPQADVERSFQECRTELGAMVRELADIHVAIGDTHRLAAAKARIIEIRKSLSQAGFDR